MFRIGDDDFGIKEDALQYRLTKRLMRSSSLFLEILGAENNFEALSEKPEWDWALYPPKLYISGLPIKNSGVSSFSRSKLENYDCAVYLMEHNFFVNLEIELTPNKIIVKGECLMIGNNMPVYAEINIA